MKLTKEIALWYKDKVIEIGNLSFEFSVEGPKLYGELLVAALTIDAFENGEWDHELSNTYQLGDIINPEHEPWAFPTK